MPATMPQQQVQATSGMVPPSNMGSLLSQTQMMPSAPQQLEQILLQQRAQTVQVPGAMNSMAQGWPGNYMPAAPQAFMQGTVPAQGAMKGAAWPQAFTQAASFPTAA